MSEIHIKKVGFWRYQLKTSMKLKRSIDEVFDFFSSINNLNLITPPVLKFRILGNENIVVKNGTIFKYRLFLHGFPFIWRSKINQWNPPNEFVDEQISGPFLLWNHLHKFSEVNGYTLIEDIVDYKVPGGFFINKLFVKRDLINIFTFRHEKLEKIFS